MAEFVVHNGSPPGQDTLEEGMVQVATFLHRQRLQHRFCSGCSGLFRARRGCRWHRVLHVYSHGGGGGRLSPPLLQQVHHEDPLYRHVTQTYVDL